MNLKLLRFVRDVVSAPKAWIAQKSIVTLRSYAVVGVPHLRDRRVRLRYADGREVWLGLN